jgi:S1/P1 Nuclease
MRKVTFGKLMKDGVDLNNEITAAEPTTWETFDLKAWAAESNELARMVAYVDENGSFLEDGAELEDAYFHRASPVVRQRLKQAGVRLAFLINSAAAGTLPRNMIEP